MSKTMKWSEIQQIIKEEINTEIQRNPTMSKSAFPETEKTSNQVYKDAESKRVETDTKKAPGALQAKDTPMQPYTGFDRDNNKGLERIKYDNIDDKFQKRVNALAMGKDSPLQKDIDESEQGVSTSGNEKFVNRSKEANQYDNDTNGFGKDNKAGILFGSDIEVLDGDKPAHQDSAFENTNNNTKNQMNEEKTLENKIQKGEIFIESKRGLSLKVIGLSEDKKSIKFIDESTNKQYSLLKENFKRSIENNTLLRENVFNAYREWALAVRNFDLDRSKQLSDSFNQKYGMHPVNTESFEKDKKTQEALDQMAKMNEDIAAPNAQYDADGKIDSISEPFKKVVKEPVTGQVPTPQHGTLKEQKSRLIFNKTKFLCESHVFSLIPEHFKVDGKQFKMIDNTGNEYLIEWNQKAEILEHKNENAVQEQMKRMKQLWEHKPENTDRKIQENTCILDEVRKNIQKEE